MCEKIEKTFFALFAIFVLFAIHHPFINFSFDDFHNFLQVTTALKNFLIFGLSSAVPLHQLQFPPIQQKKFKASLFTHLIYLLHICLTSQERFFCAVFKLSEKYYFTQPWWPSGLEHCDQTQVDCQSKIQGFNPAWG